MRCYCEFEPPVDGVSKIIVVIDISSIDGSVDKIFWPLTPIREFLKSCSLIDVMKNVTQDNLRLNTSAIPDQHRSTKECIFSAIDIVATEGDAVMGYRAELIKMYIDRCETLLIEEINLRAPKNFSQNKGCLPLKKVDTGLECVIQQKHTAIAHDTARRYNGPIQKRSVSPNKEKRRGSLSPPEPKRHKSDCEDDELVALIPNRLENNTDGVLDNAEDSENPFSMIIRILDLLSHDKKSIKPKENDSIQCAIDQKQKELDQCHQTLLHARQCLNSLNQYIGEEHERYTQLLCCINELSAIKSKYFES